VLGVVGWSVTVPSLAGAALGAWIDHRWHGRISWAVSLFLSGLLIGCFAAWKRIGGKPK
jgi:ATP synthase protein I